MTDLAVRAMPSPVGLLRLVAGDAGLAAILWERDDPARVRLGALRAAPTHPVLDAAEQQLAAYFAGTRTRFDLPLAAAGSDFQRQVWAALAAIPYGRTASYRAIAQAIGRPTAVRAVATAIGRNPLSIVVACHRVIGTDGTLTGFAGGLPAKRYLLALEAGQGGLVP